MKNLILSVIIAVLAPLLTHAQPPAYELSDPIPDMPLTGWNKVLQIRNGNTVMIHLEPRKGIVVKVFNKEHKLIASRVHICTLFDINALENTAYKGFYDIGGEAVLFMQQPYSNHLSLFRLRFNAENGSMIKEEPMIESRGFSNPVYCDVEYIKASDEYAILMTRNLVKHPDEKTLLGIWNNHHEQTKTAVLDISSTDLNAARCLQLKAEGRDIYTSFRIVTQDKHGQYRQFVLFARLPEKDTVFKSRLLETPAEGEAMYTLMSYNDFAQKENLYITMLGVTEHESDAKFKTYEITLSPYLGAFDPYTMTAERVVPVSYEQVHNGIKGYKNLLLSDSWKPVRMRTNTNGLTIMAYEQMTTGYNFAKGHYYPKTYLGNIGISMLGDDGKELFACIIPKRQDLNAWYFYSGNMITSRNKTRYLFDQWPENAFNSQFTSFDMVPVKYNSYILFNDNKLNFDVPAGDTLQRIDNYDYSNAVCYTLNRKKELSKTNLFGPAADNEYKSCMLESASYDEATGTYAVLMLHRVGKHIDTKLAWIHFTP